MVRVMTGIASCASGLRCSDIFETSTPAYLHHLFSLFVSPALSLSLSVGVDAGSEWAERCE